MEELKLRLEEINKKIASLKIEKENIEHELMNHGSLGEKFKIWCDSNTATHLRWMPDKKTYPVLSKFIDKHLDLSKNETVYLLERLEEEFYLAFEGTEKDFENEWVRKTYNEEYLAEIRDLAKEMMEKNFESFSCSW